MDLKHLNESAPTFVRPTGAARYSRRSAGWLVLATLGLSGAAKSATTPTAPPFELALPVGILWGYGFIELGWAVLSSRQRSAQERHSDRMAALELPNWVTTGSPRLYLGPATGSPDHITHVHWPEWGYHDAKLKEGATYSHPVSPREGLALSDKRIFEEALGRRAAGLMNSNQAYARDYLDRQGKDLRIVAARLPDGQTYVAESDGRNATAYEVNARRG